jgi:hypothetical protein
MLVLCQWCLLSSPVCMAGAVSPAVGAIASRTPLVPRHPWRLPLSPIVCPENVAQKNGRQRRRNRRRADLATASPDGSRRPKRNPRTESNRSCEQIRTGLWEPNLAATLVRRKPAAIGKWLLRPSRHAIDEPRLVSLRAKKRLRPPANNAHRFCSRGFEPRPTLSVFR